MFYTFYYTWYLVQCTTIDIDGTSSTYYILHTYRILVVVVPVVRGTGSILHCTVALLYHQRLHYDTITEKGLGFLNLLGVFFGLLCMVGFLSFYPSY